MSKTFTFLATLLSGSLFAQDTLRSTMLDEVVVTANKTEQKQSTTGKVVTVISKSQIEKSTGKTVAQVLNEQAGIIINGGLSSTGSVQTVFMRGAGPGRTLILMDGIPVNDPSQLSNDFDLHFLSIHDVERIEICKGAQSTLYGSDAIAGVINIITTKTNITQPAHLRSTVTAGGLGARQFQLQFYGKTGKLSYTTRYARLQNRGFSAAYDSVGTKNYDRDGYLGNTVNANLQLQATPGFLLKGFTQYSAYNAAVDAAGFVDRAFYDIHNTNHTTGLGLVLKKNIFSVTGNYQFSRLHRNYDDNASAGAPVFSMNDYNARTHFAELYTSVKPGTGFTILAGADYRYGMMNNDYRSVSMFGPYNSRFNDTAMNQVSGYLSFHYNNKRFSAETGGRLTRHSKYGTHYTYTINPSYAFDEHFRIFGSIASAFKAPSLYQLYSGNGNPDLKAEVSVSYEAGLQHSYKGFNDRLVFFYRTTNNGIDYNSVSFKYFNYAKQMARGIEYEITVQPAKGLSLTGNYTFITTRETTQSRISFKDTLYNYSLRCPTHMFNLRAGYQFNSSIYASLGGKYAGERNDLGEYRSPDIGMPGYFIMNVYAEAVLSDGKLKAFADIQNLWNRKFFEIRGYNGIPAVLSLGVTLSL